MRAFYPDFDDAAYLLDTCLASTLHLCGAAADHEDDDDDASFGDLRHLWLRLHGGAQIVECLQAGPNHRLRAQMLTDHLSSPTTYLKLEAEVHPVTPLMKMLTIGPNALKEARTTKEHFLSPMSNLRLAIARLSRKRENYAMAQELLIQVGVSFFPSVSLSFFLSLSFASFLFLHLLFYILGSFSCSLFELSNSKPNPGNSVTPL